MRGLSASFWGLAVAGLAGVAVVALARDRMGGEPKVTEHWDWTGIIGTGQSLSVGARAMPVKSTVQPYGNLKLSTGKEPWPIDPNDPVLQMAPLVEPIGRIAPNYPSSWPENIDGETPHTAAGNQISAMSIAKSGHDMVTVHSAVGEDGQGMQFLKKDPTKRGLNGRSYEAAIIETKAIARLAKAAGKSYGVGAIFVTHGESDGGNPNYEAQLYQLWSDYNTDLREITGQKRPILMITSQQNSVVDYSPSTLAEWKIGVDHPGDVVCSGPKYQYPYVSDAVHLNADGYRMLGEKYGEVFFERFVLGRDWQPLQPVGLTRRGTTLIIKFHVPNRPLVWDSALEPPHPSIPEWKNGKGFEVSTSAGEKVAIESAEIRGDSVTLKCATDPGSNARVSYAMVGEKTPRMVPVPGTRRWGLLRDSDSIVGASTQVKQPNFCVAFQLTAP